MSKYLRRLAGALSALATLAPLALAAEQAVPEAASFGPVTFTRHVAPILFRHCAQCHHPDGPAPFSLLTYTDVRPRASLIAKVTKSRVMPPWQVEPGYGEFLGKRPLTASEISLLEAWERQGAREGDPGELPRLPPSTGGWQLGTPDLIVTAPEPYTMPGASGPDIYHTFVIPIPTNAPRFVRGMEFRPGNARVHHANIGLDQPSGSRAGAVPDPMMRREGPDPNARHPLAGHLTGWSVGQADSLLPEDLSWRLDPGSSLVVQLHMLSTGGGEVVRPSVGFFFAEQPPKRTPALLRFGRQGIDIPAGEQQYVVTDSYVLPVGVDVLALKPHAHSRAREIKAYATLPDGSRRWLIYIRNWDVEWQHIYRYISPVALPQHTRVTMEYTYDNSAGNPRNPVRPPQRARWGPRATDEMGDLWLQVLTRNIADLAVLNREFQRKVLEEDVIGYEMEIEREPGNIALHDEVASLYVAVGRPLKAVDHFAAAVRLNPDSATACFNLAVALRQAGLVGDAIGQYRAALGIDPDFAEAHFNLAYLLGEQDRQDEALAHYLETVRVQPRHQQAHNNVGFILMKRGRAHEALRHFRHSLQIDPLSPSVQYNAGIAFSSVGNAEAAIGHFRKALQLQPDWLPVLTDLAWTYATAFEDRFRDPRVAVQLAERAAILTGRRDAKVLDVLAAAYAAAGQYDRAVDVIGQALGLNPPVPLVREMLAHQERYRKGEAYRERANSR
jgi:tetratricopeptide (TPR) repeat protein